MMFFAFSSSTILQWFSTILYYPLTFSTISYYVWCSFLQFPPAPLYKIFNCVLLFSTWATRVHLGLKRSESRASPLARSCKTKEAVTETDRKRQRQTQTETDRPRDGDKDKDRDRHYSSTNFLLYIFHYFLILSTWATRMHLRVETKRDSCESASDRDRDRQTDGQTDFSTICVSLRLCVSLPLCPSVCLTVSVSVEFLLFPVVVHYFL